MSAPHVPRPDIDSTRPVEAFRRGTVRRPRGIGRSQTNVPDHAGQVVLPPARRVHIICLPRGEEADHDRVSRAAEQMRELAAGTQVAEIDYPLLDNRAIAHFVEAVGAMTVGEVVVLIGLERDVFALRSIALAFGFESDEIITRCTDGEATSVDGVRWSSADSIKELFCVHCRHLFPARAAVGDSVRCPHCDLALVVEYNFSRQRAAYLASNLR